MQSFVKVFLHGDVMDTKDPSTGRNQALPSVDSTKTTPQGGGANETLRDSSEVSELPVGQVLQDTAVEATRAPVDSANAPSQSSATRQANIPQTEVFPILTSTRQIDYIMLRPDKDEPGITYWFSDGNKVVSVFGDDKECARVWALIEVAIRNSNFVYYYNTFFNSERLLTLEKCRTEELGHHLYFRFPRTPGFKQQYANEVALLADYAQPTDLLAIVQDLRAGYEASPTKH